MKCRDLIWILLRCFLAIFVLTACNTLAEQSAGRLPDSDEKFKVVATTTIVRDIVYQVGGDLIELDLLIPVGMDPHSFDPTPQDVAKISEADLVFANGVGLEEFLDNLIDSAGAEDKLVHVSDNIDFLFFQGQANDPDDQEHEHENTGADPHTWTDPANVMIWLHSIENELSRADPENADGYRTNAQAYQAELENLDAWIRDQVDRIIVENRKLVTDHALFGYYARAYGFEQVGALIPGYSTLAEPTAQELAIIEDSILELGVKAIFVGYTINPDLAERVAEDTGTQLVYVYTGSLSEPGGEADSYLEYMRYNTNAFVNALK